MSGDNGASVSDQALVNESPAGLHPSGFDPSRDFACAARKSGTAGGNDPQDCDWPVCGCDPYANKVIGALDESGRLAEGCTPHRKESHVPDEVQMDREAKAWRDGMWAASDARQRAAYPELDF